MRIAVISTTTGVAWGGSEELWAAMVEEAVKEDLNVAVSIASQLSIPTKFESFKADRITVMRRRPLLRFRIEEILSKIASPFGQIFRWTPDVICISQSWSYESLYFSDLLRLLNNGSIPYVVVCQFNDDHAARRSDRELAKTFFGRAFRVVFVSVGNMTSVERQLAHSLPNAALLQNPVNLLDFERVPWPLSRTVNMASVARLDATYKGQDILLEVLGSPGWRLRNWTLRFYGNGEDRSYLEELAQHYGIKDRVEFCGHVTDIRSIWQMNHILLLPSRAEGTPLALVEAMLCGRPAVVTAVGGNAEWIQDECTGFVADAPTRRSFGAALERAWAGQSLWKTMGAQARKNAIVRFDKSPGKSLLKILLNAAANENKSSAEVLTNSLDCLNQRGSLASRSTLTVESGG